MCSECQPGPDYGIDIIVIQRSHQYTVYNPDRNAQCTAAAIAPHQWAQVYKYANPKSLLFELENPADRRCHSTFLFAMRMCVCWQSV